MFSGKKGSAHSKLHPRMLLAVHLLWISLVGLLGAWWGRLLMSQAARIAELEKKLGWATDVAQTHWHRTQRMLFWESLSFFILLVACTALLIWLYWRDVKRARSLQAFFASVTHELRTPLTSIRLQAEALAENIDPVHQMSSQGNFIQRLLEDSVRLEGQVERTLELARVEGGGPVYVQMIQIKPWLERFLKTWMADYKGKLEQQVQLDDLLIQADPSALQVIFKNIFENSIRHTDRPLPRLCIRTSADPDEQKVQIIVSDDGKGFLGSPKDLGKLFQKGSRSQGTGVGLYLVQTLMKRMGGFVEFKNHDGFEVVLTFVEGVENG